MTERASVATIELCLNLVLGYRIPIPLLPPSQTANPIPSDLSHCPIIQRCLCGTTLLPWPSSPSVYKKAKPLRSFPPAWKRQGDVMTS